MWYLLMSCPTACAAPRHDCGPPAAAPREPAHRARAAPFLLEAALPLIMLQADLVLAVLLHPRALAQVQLARVPARGLSGRLSVYVGESTTRSCAYERDGAVRRVLDDSVRTLRRRQCLPLPRADGPGKPRTTPRRWRTSRTGRRLRARARALPTSESDEDAAGACGGWMDGGWEGARVGREDGAVRDVLVGWVPAGRAASMHYALCNPTRRCIRIRACRAGLSGVTVAGTVAARGADDERTNEYTARKRAGEKIFWRATCLDDDDDVARAARDKRSLLPLCTTRIDPPPAGVGNRDIGAVASSSASILTCSCQSIYAVLSTIELRMLGRAPASTTYSNRPGWTPNLAWLSQSLRGTPDGDPAGLVRTGNSGSPEFSEWHGEVQEKRKGKERSGERGGRKPGNILRVGGKRPVPRSAPYSAVQRGRMIEYLFLEYDGRGTGLNQNLCILVDPQSMRTSRAIYRMHQVNQMGHGVKAKRTTQYNLLEIEINLHWSLEAKLHSLERSVHGQPCAFAKAAGCSGFEDFLLLFWVP
ncbi:hypothetical protein B0H14DRAFT_3583598 [Mycena olivaceomarginata]|nr:hypothetical protein B0H14DRAFT_3583598 [Mycena olivaceomarginata]